MKFQRLLKRQTLVFSTVSSKPADSVFHYVTTPDIERRLHRLTLRVGHGLMPNAGDAMTRERTGQYITRSAIEEAITSSQLEGAATTRAVARDMILNKRPPRDSGEKMILNNYQAMEFLRESKPARLDRQLVLEIHRRVTEGALDKEDAAGRFRRSDEPVRVFSNEDEVLHTPPPAEQLEERLERMCAFANGQYPSGFVHPVLRAIILHFWLAYDHPFYDGNGRTARALFYWCVMNEGYDLFQYISISEILVRAAVKYGTAFLHTETDDNDVTYFVEHQLGVIERAVGRFEAYVRQQLEQQRNVQDLLRTGRRFNYRQQALLGHAMRHPGFRYTIEGHRRSHAIAYGTARSDLMKLAEAQLLLQRRYGKEFVFEVPADIIEQIRR